MNAARKRELLASAMRKEKLARAESAPKPLVVEKTELQKYLAPLDDEAIALQAELRILKELESKSQPILQKRRGILNEEEVPLEIADHFGWTMPHKYKELTDEQVQVLLMNDGSVIEDPLNIRWEPIQKFKHLKLPAGILGYLDQHGIHKPTAIQKLAIPIALSGRNVLGVAGTGSGKTLSYLIPVMLLSYIEELKAPFVPRKPPVGLVLAPNRELALQVQGIAQTLGRCLSPRLNCAAFIGGTPLKQNESILVEDRLHAVVGTPGRIKDLMDHGVLCVSGIKMLVLDEADRLLDVGFTDSVGHICQAITHAQSVLFSATMPTRVKQFAQSALNQAVTIMVGRAGKATMNVEQRIDIIAPTKRLVFLFKALHETPPPAIVFCASKAEVDDVLEALISEGFAAAAIHGGLDQVDRSQAIQRFINGERDILIGTDVASKGLDLPNVQHVINYSLPQDVEDYVHRIGRAGRRGNRGLATTFVTSVFDENVLLDLRGILLEVQQNVPQFLHTLAKARGLPDVDIECAYCGGPGHRVMNCSKLQVHRSSLNVHNHSRIDG